MTSQREPRGRTNEERAYYLKALVANALGVRVPVLPLTPQRVLEALAKAPKA